MSEVPLWSYGVPLYRGKRTHGQRGTPVASELVRCVNEGGVADRGPTVGPQGGACPLFRVTPVVERGEHVCIDDIGCGIMSYAA
jgi:hypothetical protein